MRIRALSEVLPGDPVTNRDLAERFGLHERWLERMTGNRTRYLCRADSPDGVPKLTGDLAVEAGRRAMDAAAVTPGDLDFLILTTASPDHLMPSTANLVADRLGLNDLPALQLTSGCAGAVQGLHTARALLASGAGRGLVIGADTCRKLMPESDEAVRALGPAGMVNFAMFGDGAGAAVVEAEGTGPALTTEHLVLRTVGKGRPPAQVVRWYGVEGAPRVPGPRGALVRESMAEEDYKAIEANVPGLAAGVLTELAAAVGWDVPEVEHILTPQLNGVMTERIREHMGVRSDQAVSCVADTGNNGNALPFIQLHRAVAPITDDPAADGDRFLLTAIESSKWVVSGMALRWDGGEPR
ncbi:3-oxoacyl-ACP synthase III family protein [Nocardiopsis sp. EMB25]|uniref:3-oxoacyl-ACP synthase III family protein n=1 Tax=Nocardiopsis TaxID=2013 RepID=UPI00034A02BB|nr:MULTISPECIES: 3-oxoacyl-ACP synthase III family protein [Nocardiopsis]MCY9783905.1 3-oxoacyl-ACP synthase III family protein [Nocardiopsis sp. EMB25]